MTRKFAVFDIDGTLIRWQLYHAVVDKLASSGALGDQAKHNLRSARMVWKNREHSEAFKDYEHELINVYESAIGDIDTGHFDELVDEVIEEYKDQVYTYTRDLLIALKSEGYFLVAISGSHNELVEKLAKYYGFDEWAGTKYERKSGRFSGNKFVASLNKKTLLEAIIKNRDLNLKDSYGVGDSMGDAPMLEIVDNPIAFNPAQDLYQLAKEKGWQIVVERKNVVYRLEKSDNLYKLQ